jgi:hypothetical protein
MTDHEATRRRPPTIRVLSADATDEEIAAILAVLSAAARGDQVPEDGTTSTWSGHRSRRRAVREAFSPGPACWRTSYWPR